MRTGVLLAALVAGDAANRSVDEATQALADDVRELQRQNKLLRQQNALLLKGHPPQPPPQPQREARASDLERERGPEYTTNNPYDRAQYDELASQDSEWHAAWKRAKAEDHQVEWGEDHYNPWLPDPANSKKRPVPNMTAELLARMDRSRDDQSRKNPKENRRSGAQDAPGGCPS